MVVSIIITVSVFFRKEAIGYLVAALNWIQKSGYRGMAAMIVIYAIATVLFVPGLILTLGAGFIFKYWGIPIISIGSTLGASIAFLLGQTLARGLVESAVKDYPKFRAIDEAVKIEGWKMILLLRLIPLVPFNFLNYALALTSINIFTYIFFSWIGMFPGTVLYVYIGISAGSLADIIAGRTQTGTWWVQLIIFGSTGVLVVIGFILIGFIARKYIKKYLHETQIQEEAIEDPNVESSESQLLGIARDDLCETSHLLQQKRETEVSLPSDDNHSENSK